MRDYIGVPMPPPEQSSPIYVRWCQPGAPLDVTLLEDCPYNVPVHWVPMPGKSYRVTRRCTKPDVCAHCALGVTATAAAYLGAWSHNLNRFIATAYGPDTFKHLCDQFPEEEPFRGGRILMSRSTSSPSSPILITRKINPLRPLPECPDIRPCLRSLFGADLFPDCPPYELSDENGGCS